MPSGRPRSSQRAQPRADAALRKSPQSRGALHVIVRSVARRSYVYSARRYARGRCRSAAALAARRGLRFEDGHAVPDVLPSNRIRLLSSPLCLVGRDRRLALAAWICSALRRWNRASSTARPAGAAPSQMSMRRHLGSSFCSSSLVTVREEREREQESAGEAQRERFQSLSGRGPKLL